MFYKIAVYIHVCKVTQFVWCTPMYFHAALHFFSVSVSFAPTNYTVTEGVDEFVELILVRSRDTNRSTTVTVCTESGTAVGMAEYY